MLAVGKDVCTLEMESVQRVRRPSGWPVAVSVGQAFVKLPDQVDVGHGETTVWMVFGPGHATTAAGLMGPAPSWWQETASAREFDF